MRYDAARGLFARFLIGSVLLGSLLAGCAGQSASTAPPAAPATSGTTVKDGAAPSEGTQEGPGPEDGTPAGSPGPAGSSPVQSPSPETTEVAVVRLGVILPLSGELAEQGQESLRAIQAAADEVNSLGGVDALGGARLQLVTADSKGDPGVGREQVQRLAHETELAAVISGLQSTVSLPVAEAAERLRLPVLIAFAAADEITEQELAFTFRLCPKAEWYARDQVRFLADLSRHSGVPLTKVALLHEDGAFGRATAASQKEYLARVGIEVVDEIAYPADQPDLHEEILRIKAGEAEAVLTATYLNDALLVAEGVAVARLSVPVIDAGGGFLHPGFVAGLGEKADGLLTTVEYQPGTAAKRLEDRYREEYGAALNSAGLYSYQAVWVLAHALEKAKSPDPERVRQALKATVMTEEDHVLLPQSLLTFDGSGQNAGARLLITQIQEGRYVSVWPQAYAEGAFRPAR